MHIIYTILRSNNSYLNQFNLNILKQLKLKENVFILTLITIPVETVAIIPIS